MIAGRGGSRGPGSSGDSDGLFRSLQAGLRDADRKPYQLENPWRFLRAIAAAIHLDPVGRGLYPRAATDWAARFASRFIRRSSRTWQEYPA
jgi:hypothetical protein